MNLFLSISLMFVLQGSTLDCVRSLEAALKEYSTTKESWNNIPIVEGNISKGELQIKNLGDEKPIEAKIVISVLDNNSRIVKMSLTEIKTRLYTAHREIMRKALLRATHD
jgi:hypothetical protein